MPCPDGIDLLKSEGIHLFMLVLRIRQALFQGSEGDLNPFYELLYDLDEAKVRYLDNNTLLKWVKEINHKLQIPLCIDS